MTYKLPTCNWCIRLFSMSITTPSTL